MDVLGNDLTQTTLDTAIRGHMRRQELISQNVANANTPRYQRRDVTFRGMMRQALEEGSRSSSIRALNAVEPQPLEKPADSRNDGGGVDIDREMAVHAQNTIRIEGLQEVVRKRIQTYKKAIVGNRG